MTKKGIFSVTPVATKPIGIVATKPKVVNTTAEMREFVRAGSRAVEAASAPKPPA
jgi:hypothetical protein